MRFIFGLIWFAGRYVQRLGYTVSELRMASGSRLHFWGDTLLYVLIGWHLMKATDNSNLLVAGIAFLGCIAITGVWLKFMYVNNAIAQGDREWPAEDRNHWILDVTLCLILMAITAIRIAYLGYIDSLGIIGLGYPVAYLVGMLKSQTDTATTEGGM